MNHKLKTIVLWILVLTCFAGQASQSDEFQQLADLQKQNSFEEVLQWAIKANAIDIGVYRHLDKKHVWQKGLAAENSRLKLVHCPPHPFHLPDLSDCAQRGISPYCRVFLSQKCKRPGYWCFRFSEEKHLIVGGMSGNHFGTRLISGPYGDVNEISREKATKSFGAPKSCSAPRFFLLTARKYN